MSASSPVHEKLDDASPWGEVALVYRRVCVLRANGHSLEAARVQSTELSRALAALRAIPEAAADSDARLRALFAAEEERVLNARVLAELLVPLLSEHLGGLRPPAPRRATVASPAPAAAAAEPAVPAGSGPTPGIADFIDEMLAQDRAAGGDRTRRRAS